MFAYSHRTAYCCWCCVSDFQLVQHCLCRTNGKRRELAATHADHQSSPVLVIGSSTTLCKNAFFILSTWFVCAHARLTRQTIVSTDTPLHWLYLAIVLVVSLSVFALVRLVRIYYCFCCYCSVVVAVTVVCSCVELIRLVHWLSQTTFRLKVNKNRYAVRPAVSRADCCLWMICGDHRCDVARSDVSNSLCLSVIKSLWSEYSGPMALT